LPQRGIAAARLAALLAELYPVSLTPSVTERGVHVIKQWERHRSKKYFDGWTPTTHQEIWSKGFGHSNLLTNVNFDEREEWPLEYAHEVLVNHDLPYFGGLLLPHLKVPVPNTIWSMCMSLSMNKGVGKPGNERGLINSEAWKILHDGKEYNFERFCDAVLEYALIAPNKITKEPEVKRGLRWRRQAEVGLHQQDRFEDYL
jgi:hypothetical protein